MKFSDAQSDFRDFMLLAKFVKIRCTWKISVLQ